MKFDVGKTIQFWLQGAKYDMEVADAMFDSEKYPYSLFMGHLALEKLLKAPVVEKTETCSFYSFSSVACRNVEN